MSMVVVKVEQLVSRKIIYVGPVGADCVCSNS